MSTLFGAAAVASSHPTSLGCVGGSIDPQEEEVAPDLAAVATRPQSAAKVTIVATHSPVVRLRRPSRVHAREYWSLIALLGTGLSEGADVDVTCIRDAR